MRAATCIGDQRFRVEEHEAREPGGAEVRLDVAYVGICGTDLHTAVEYGAAHGALAMTTPGDTSTARLPEVRRLVERGGPRVQR
jgi:2-dehydro-3-deoxygluconokinase